VPVLLFQENIQEKSHRKPSISSFKGPPLFTNKNDLAYPARAPKRHGIKGFTLPDPPKSKDLPVKINMQLLDFACAILNQQLNPEQKLRDAKSSVLTMKKRDCFLESKDVVQCNKAEVVGKRTHTPKEGLTGGYQCEWGEFCTSTQVDNPLLREIGHCMGGIVALGLGNNRYLLFPTMKLAREYWYLAFCIDRGTREQWEKRICKQLSNKIEMKSLQKGKLCRLILWNKDSQKQPALMHATNETLSLIIPNDPQGDLGADKGSSWLTLWNR
jgi:hypothetical protein